jgi:hypothetical protein
VIISVNTNWPGFVTETRRVLRVTLKCTANSICPAIISSFSQTAEKIRKTKDDPLGETQQESVGFTFACVNLHPGQLIRSLQAP